MPRENSTKVWLTSSGGTVVANNRSRIPSKDLFRLLVFIEANIPNTQFLWVNRFGYLSYYC